MSLVSQRFSLTMLLQKTDFQIRISHKFSDILLLSGGIVLPLLGAVPDSAIIIVSGLGADAQSKLSVGMG